MSDKKEINMDDLDSVSGGKGGLWGHRCPHCGKVTYGSKSGSGVFAKNVSMILGEGPLNFNFQCAI